MKQFTEILKGLFLFIAPVTLLLLMIFWGIHWSAEYQFQGQTCKAELLKGFPFPAAGLFDKMNHYGAARSMTVNWANYYLNIACVFLFVTLIYWFLLRKIRIKTIEGKIALIAIAIPVYAFSWFFFLIVHNIEFDYESGKWPEHITIKKFSYSRPI